MALIITQAGLAALATAESTGSKLQATHMAVGDGNGQPVSHTSQSVELLGETWRGELQEIKVVDSGEVEFIAHIPFAVGGWYMREAAIYAADTLLAIGSHPEVWKPDPEAPDKVELLVTAPVKFTNTDVINLTVDTTKVLASQEMVISAVAQHDEDNNAHAGALSALKDHPADPNAHESLFQAVIQAIANHAGADDAHAALFQAVAQTITSHVDANNAHADLFQAVINQLPNNASTTIKGLVELATNAETLAGMNPSLAVTPPGLKYIIDTQWGIVTQKATRTTTGNWNITGLTIGRPLYITIGGTGLTSFYFTVVSGANSGQSSCEYVLQTAGSFRTPPGTVIIPTATTVVLSVSSTSGTTARAYQ